MIAYQSVKVENGQELELCMAGECCIEWKHLQMSREGLELIRILWVHLRRQQSLPITTKSSVFI